MNWHQRKQSDLRAYMNRDDTKDTEELIRRIERAKRGDTAEKRIPPDFGFALHCGSRDGSLVIFVTTQGGERLPLTVRMIRGLRPQVVCVQGVTLCIVDVPPGHDHTDHEPLDCVEITTIHRPRSPDGATYTPLTSLLTPEVLANWPTILTTDRRPKGWPR